MREFVARHKILLVPIAAFNAMASAEVAETVDREGNNCWMNTVG